MLAESIVRVPNRESAFAEVTENPGRIAVFAWRPDDEPNTAVVPLTVPTWGDVSVPPPTLETVASAEYPFVEHLRLFAEHPEAGVVGEFVAFVESERGREILREHRYVPESTLPKPADPDPVVAQALPGTEPPQPRPPADASAPAAPGNSRVASPPPPPPPTSGTSLGELLGLAAFLGVLAVVVLAARRRV